MKKLLSILMGLGLILILVGCSLQETATLTQKLGDVEGTLVYTYDKEKDIVTKFKFESTASAADSEPREENQKLFDSVKGMDGVVTSMTEKDGKLIATVEIDLKKIKWSTIKKSDSLLLFGLAQSSFLIGEDDDASFSRSKKAAEILGFTEQKK